MQMTSGRTLVFALILALIAGPVLPVFATYTDGITDDSLRHRTDIGYDQTSVRKDHCVEHSSCDDDCCASCVNCPAVSLADLPTTPHFTMPK